MELEVWRYSSGADATLGFMMERGSATWRCHGFTCEDEHRQLKKYGETRIPAGRYQIKLRNVGGMSAKYRVRYPKTHRGMLHLIDVPGFEYVYIHIGNDDDDTLGCILIGMQRSEGARTIAQSRVAYERFYPRAAAAIEAEGLWITVKDLDRGILPSPR